ncbi:MAG: phage tail tape measure protein, partial [Vicinamibacterales bacterium]
MATIYNVIKWADNTQELDKHLQQGLGTTEKVTKALDKMARSLAGEKVARDAKLMADALGGVEGASLLTEKAQARVNKVMTEAIGIYRTLGKDPPQIFRDLAAATQQHAKTLEDAQKRLNSYATGAKSIGAGMTVAVTAPIVAGFGLASKAAIDFESSFAGVRKTVDASDAELQGLAKGFRDLAKEIPINVNELNRIGESAGQLGIKTENILGFSKVMAELGVTTNLSSDQAATSLARLANITQMPQDQFDRLGSTVVGLGNTFATTESEIVDMGLRIAGAGEIAGLTEPQILAIGAAMSSVGMEAEAGGTAVQKVLNDMTAAVAAGGPKLEEFARTAGLSAADFATAYKQDAGNAFALFVEGLGRQGDQAFSTLDNLGLGNERVIRAFLSLGNAGDLLREALGRGSLEWERNTALVDEAGKRFGTTESKLTTLWNKATDVAITIGTAMAPAIEAAIGVGERAIPVVEMLAQGFAALPPTAQMVVLGLFALTAAAGPLIYISGQMASSASLLIDLWRNKATAGRALSTTYGVMSTNVGALSTSTRLLGTATTVTAGAFAGWTLGRIIAETFDLDTKIGNLTAKILRLGDVQAETAGAKQDSINLAIQRGAAATVSYTEAIKFNDEWVRKRTDALRAGATVQQQTVAGLSFATAGFDTLTAKLKTAEGEIQRLSAAQRDDLSKALQSGVFDMKELATATGVSEDALKIFQRQVKTTAKEAAQDTREMAKAFEAAYQTVQKFAQASAFGGTYDRLQQNTLSAPPRLWLEQGQQDPTALRQGWSWMTEYMLRRSQETLVANPYLGDVRGPVLTPGIDQATLDRLPKGSAFEMPVGLLPGLDKAVDGVDRWARSLTQLSQVSGDTFSGIVQDIARIVVSYQMASDAADSYNKASDVSGKALALVQGATAVWSATGQGSRGARIAGGALTGAKIGSVVPGVGTAVGAGVGALVGYLRSTGVSKQEKEGRAAFAEIEAQYGGFEGLLARVGSAYDAMGRSSREAQDDVANLMDVTRAGGPAVQGTWEEINRVIQ